MNLNDLKKQQARGKMRFAVQQGSGTANATGAAVNSGGMTITMSAALGSSFPSSLVGLAESATNTDMMHLMGFMSPSSTARGSAIVRLYKLGELNLAATGNQFTHHSATYPVRRKLLGVSNSNVRLIPLIQITTATATTAPVIRLRTVAGGAGYKNQANVSVVGNVDFTFPSATTAVNSVFRLRLNVGDYAVTDINHIQVVTAASAGTATVWGMEMHFPVQSSSFAPTMFDSFFGSLLLPIDTNPAAPVSGTAESYMLGLGFNSISAHNISGFDLAVEAL